MAALFIVCMLFADLAPVFAQTDDPIPPEDTANGFNPEFILDDRDIFEIGMTREQLGLFLASRGTLGRTEMPDIDGVKKPVADIIWRISTSYRINPKYLLVLLQKEQSLVEDPNPSQRQFDWATGFAVCDSCSKDDPAIQDFKGFANQLEYAAKQHRERYLIQILSRGTTVSGYAPGITKTVSGMSITPRNNATAMLYTYTPHIHGNLNLWRIWRRWFTLDLPDGTLVRSKSTGKIYLIRFGSKRPFRSLSVVASLADLAKVVDVDEPQLSAYPNGREIAFPNYSIIETPDGKRYLIVGDKKRLIASEEIFRALGFLEDDIVEATDEDAAMYEAGPDITAKTQFPTGILAKGPDGRIWYVEDGTKQRIPHPVILNLYFKGRQPKAMTQVQIDSLATGGTYTLRDGELVRGTSVPAVYVVEHGTLRPIMSAEAFEGMGWSWRNVIVVPDGFITGYPQGLPVDLKPSAPAPEPTVALDQSL